MQKPEKCLEAQKHLLIPEQKTIIPAELRPSAQNLTKRLRLCIEIKGYFEEK